MKVQTGKRFVLFTALIATFLLSAVSALPQRRIPVEEIALPIKGNCPNPIAITLTATAPNVVNADFSPAALAAPRSFLNDPALNKFFLYTFQWRNDERCCQITKAVLTVRMKANQQGTPSGSNAHNDSIAIAHLTNAVAPFSERVYLALGNASFPAGQPAVKTWTLTGAALNNLNATRRLSFYVQDDTMVQSATLQLTGCCLSGPRASAVEEAQPSSRY